MRYILFFSVTLLLFASCGVDANNIMGIDERRYTSYDTVSTKCGQYLYSIGVQDCLRKDKDTNYVFSPLGMSALFTMVKEGSSGRTREELQKSMCVYSDIMAGYVRTLSNAYDPLAEDGRPAVVKVADAFAVSGRCRMRPRFFERMRSVFSAETMELNFSSARKTETISKWMERQMSGNSGARQDAVLCLSNNVYALNATGFKGAWRDGFDKSKTKQKCFYQYDGRKTTVDMMARSEYFYYMHNDTMQVVSLPFFTRGKVVAGMHECSMYVVLPRKGYTLDDVMKTLRGSYYGDFKRHFELKRVNIRLPRFTIHSTIDAQKLMRSLGARHMDEFDSITVKPLSLTQAHLTADISVDENGIMDKKAVERAYVSDNPLYHNTTVYNFNANHPFIYMLVDEDNDEILFMGQYTKGLIERDDKWQSITYTGKEDKPEPLVYAVTREALNAEAYHPDKKDVYDVVEQMPSFNGGNMALMKYIENHLSYPVVAEREGIQGRVILQFIVEKDGRLSDIRVARSVDPQLDAEAVRIVASMPEWIPGRNGDEVVRVRYTLPVTFRLP